ncbi:MAG: glutamate--tRNA ligase [Chitinophagaceae bacterium]|nr:glutamate--tRNA ligase [Chitinophagaceae bacterium]
MTKVRTRFAPSPTGGLHLGGVRTALFSYLFAKHHGGDFVLRIEDTDQSRFVPGAEEYIIQCLEWCGIEPDEGPHCGGTYAPYRQSERKDQYRQFAEQLVNQGHAYYAFDTPEELEAMRIQFKSESNPSPQYDKHTRNRMRNSLNLSASEVAELLESNTPYVIRIKMPENEVITFQDLIRGEISNDSALVDDKVLLKADGMPTYHLAVVVDDFTMKITHAFRGEEWLPSAPVHIKLWQYLGWEDAMPKWAHLPLILKPEGNGKLSKRDGDRLGFPVFAMDWVDPNSGDRTVGFKERGFLPQAFVNMLALLGWHSGSEKELFSLEELIREFSIERVHKGGARFDFEKAKWFNHSWIHLLSPDGLLPDVKKVLSGAGISIHSDEFLVSVIALVKDRCTLLQDFILQSSFFFNDPTNWDIESVLPKWSEEKLRFFARWSATLSKIPTWNASALEEQFKQQASEQNLKPGELQMPYRIMLVGGKFGPAVFQISEFIGVEACVRRIERFLQQMSPE